MTDPRLQVPAKLTAMDKSSFAYTTIRERLPVIIIKTLDFFYRKNRELHTFGGTVANPSAQELQEIDEDAKQFITDLVALRKLVETNKPLELLKKVELPAELDYFNDDLNEWNTALEAVRTKGGELSLCFEAPWLLVESWVYRQIKQFSLHKKQLKLFDPFVEQKQAACKASLSQMLIVANHLGQIERTVVNERQEDHTHPNEKTEFGIFIQLALWANKCDLSLSGMSADGVQAQQLQADLKQSLDRLRECILCDNTPDLWLKVQSIKERVRSSAQQIDPSKPVYIDLVADNAGYEVFVDLALMHFLTLVLCPISLGASGVRLRLHVKRMPWYVSDTIRQDIDWLLSYMQSQDQDSPLIELAEKWKSFFESKFWEVHDHKYWTLPHDYSEMQTVAKDLYATLQQSSLIIFKGDLNYRKLAGDRKWHVLTPFRAALMGFEPAPLVTLRTAKADVVVGIEDMQVYGKIYKNELPSDWMLSGQFGMIQYHDPSS